MTESAHCGRQIHLAAHALRAVRDTALENNGIAFELWVVMEVMAETAGMNRERLISRLAELAVHDRASAAQAIAKLHERGLITTTADELGTIVLSDKGKALSERSSPPAASCVISFTAASRPTILTRPDGCST